MPRAIMNKSAAFVVVVVIAFFAIAIAPHVTSSDNSDNNVYGIIGAMPEETTSDSSMVGDIWNLYDKSVRQESPSGDRWRIPEGR